MASPPRHHLKAIANEGYNAEPPLLEHDNGYSHYLASHYFAWGLRDRNPPSCDPLSDDAPWRHRNPLHQLAQSHPV